VPDTVDAVSDAFGAVFPNALPASGAAATARSASSTNSMSAESSTLSILMARDQTIAPGLCQVGLTWGVSSGVPEAMCHAPPTTRVTRRRANSLGGDARKTSSAPAERTRPASISTTGPPSASTSRISWVTTREGMASR